MTAVSVSRRSAAAGGDAFAAASEARSDVGQAQRQRRRLLGERYPLGELVVEDDADRAALPGDERQTRPRLADADRHGDRAEPLQGQQHEQELGPVREQHQDPVAGDDAARREAGGEPVGLGAGLGIGPAPTLVDDRLVAAALRPRPFEHRVQPGRPVGEAADDAIAVERLAAHRRHRMRVPGIHLGPPQTATGAAFAPRSITTSWSTRSCDVS